MGTEPEPADSDELHRVVSVDAFDDTDRVVVDIEGPEVAVIRANGEFHALSNCCPHQGGPACEGLLSGTMGVDDDFELTWERDGEIVACPWHGWEFDVTDGRHTASERYRLPTYEVRIADDELYVRL